MKKQIIYALYKGDQFIDLGTKEHLAKLLNVTPKTIKFYASPSARKRIKNYSNAMFCIRIEEEEEN